MRILDFNDSFTSNVSPTSAVLSATNVSVTPFTGLVSTNTQAAFVEVIGDINAHINKTTGAHAASAISNTASGNISATDVQSALNQVQTHIDSTNTTAAALATTVAGKEPGITAGSTAQYYRGDKTFQTLNAAAVGLGNVANIASAIPATATTNAERDSNANLSVNNLLEAFQTVASAAGTTTLLVSSPAVTQITGTTSQTVVLPAATTLAVGMSFLVFNRSSGAVIVNANGGTLVQTMAAASQCTFTCTSIGTSAGTWDAAYSTTTSSSSASPTGTVTMFASSTAPTGWLNCDGAAVSRTTYAALFALTGTTYGVGDGSTTFNVPNTSGIFVRGAGSQTISTIAYSATLGAVTGDTMQGHFHGPVSGGAFIETSLTGGNIASSGSSYGYASATTGPVSDGSHGTPRVGNETKPANIALNYIIKT